MNLQQLIIRTKNGQGNIYTVLVAMLSIKFFSAPTKTLPKLDQIDLSWELDFRGRKANFFFFGKFEL
jgi:hypothetical protein